MKVQYQLVYRHEIPSKIDVAFHITEMLKKISSYYGISIETITANNRNALGAKTRHICMYFMMQIPSMTLGKAAAYFGKSNHTTALHAINTVAEKIAEDEIYKSDILNIIELLNL